MFKDMHWPDWAGLLAFSVAVLHTLAMGCHNPTDRELQAALEFTTQARKACEVLGGKTIERSIDQDNGNDAMEVVIRCEFKDTFIYQRTGGQVEAPEVE